MIQWLREWRRKRAVDKIQIDDRQWQQAEDALPLLSHLTADERRQLRDMAREFIASKEWNGAHGLALNAGIQLVIALQACLLVLKLGLAWYDDWLGIVVYPGDFVIPRQVMDDDGIVHEYTEPALGEAWQGGPVLISWFDTPGAAYGVNAVIHEFAHKLDMSNGAIDGRPRLHSGMPRQAWTSAFDTAYADFCRRVRIAEIRGEQTQLDSYAAEHPGEFFAVMSEAFFETPQLLQHEYPAVYEQLQQFYLQDPLIEANS